MDKEKLYKLSIFTLRNMARDVGMKAPTTKKKDELISFILANEKGLPTPKVRIGRPPSVLFDTQQLNNEFVIEIRIKY